MEPFDKDTFTRAVYEIVCMIPAGRATSYGAIARAANYPNRSRLVGKILSQCPQDENIPAHRVVNSNGFLSGLNAFGNSGEMRQLLEAEGIIVFHNRIKNWKDIFWDPVQEINL